MTPASRQRDGSSARWTLLPAEMVVTLTAMLSATGRIMRLFSCVIGMLVTTAELGCGGQLSEKPTRPSSAQSALDPLLSEALSNYRSLRRYSDSGLISQVDYQQGPTGRAEVKRFRLEFVRPNRLRLELRSGYTPPDVLIVNGQRALYRVAEHPTEVDESEGSVESKLVPFFGISGGALDIFWQLLSGVGLSCEQTEGKFSGNAVRVGTEVLGPDTCVNFRTTPSAGEQYPRDFCIDEKTKLIKRIVVRSYVRRSHPQDSPFYAETTILLSPKLDLPIEDGAFSTPEKND